MLGLLLIYFIGKAYYELAEDHNRSKWGFAILGVISYYIGTFIGGIILAIVFELAGWGNIEETNDIVLGLLALPFGLGACVGLYHLIKRNWEKKASFTEDIIDEIGVDNEAG